MQVVILAAGKGTRMGERTLNTPKSMLGVAGKPVLEWKFERLPHRVTEIILVVGYLQETIMAAFGDSYKGKNIRYVSQANPVGGTMDALTAVRDVVHNSFLVLNGDDIHVQADLEACVQHEWALAVSHTPDVRSASKIVTDAENRIVDIVEADMHGGGAGLAGVGAYVLDKRVFEVPSVTLTGRTETGLPQTMLAAARTLGIRITAVPVTFPLHFTVPEDIQRAEQILSDRNSAFLRLH